MVGFLGFEVFKGLRFRVQRLGGFCGFGGFEVCGGIGVLGFGALGVMGFDPLVFR